MGKETIYEGPNKNYDKKKKKPYMTKIEPIKFENTEGVAIHYSDGTMKQAIKGRKKERR